MALEYQFAVCGLDDGGSGTLIEAEGLVVVGRGIQVHGVCVYVNGRRGLDGGVVLIDYTVGLRVYFIESPSRRQGDCWAGTGTGKKSMQPMPVAELGWMGWTAWLVCIRRQAAPQFRGEVARERPGRRLVAKGFKESRVCGACCVVLGW